MAIALVDHCKYAAGGSGGGTTGAMNSTGANLLVAACAFETSVPPLTDNKSNVWSLLSLVIGSVSTEMLAIYVSIPTTVGSGHTFTMSGSSIYPTMCVAAFSGVASVYMVDLPKYQTFNTSTNNVRAGSITPNANNCLIISGMSYRDTSAISVDSGFTITDQCPFIAATAIGSALAYLIQTIASAVNPKFTWTSATLNCAATIDFQPPASSGAGAGGAWVSA